VASIVFILSSLSQKGLTFPLKQTAFYILLNRDFPFFTFGNSTAVDHNVFTFMPPLLKLSMPIMTLQPLIDFLDNRFNDFTNC
jgi:hypothetical protein